MHQANLMYNLMMICLFKMEVAKLVNHRGGQEVSINELAMIPLPEKTESYHPLPHVDFVYELTNMSRKLIGDVGVPKISIAKEGNRMFGILPISVGRTDEYEFALGFRNSYDKSMSAGVCFGNRVFVCDNLAFNGNITIMRKHTKNMSSDLTNMLVGKLLKAEGEINVLQDDFDKMKKTLITKDAMARTLGYAYYKDVLKPQQFSIAMEQIDLSKAFQRESMWDFYQHGTEALKVAPIEKRIEACTKWHNFVLELM